MGNYTNSQFDKIINSEHTPGHLLDRMARTPWSLHTDGHHHIVAAHPNTPEHSRIHLASTNPEYRTLKMLTKNHKITPGEIQNIAKVGAEKEPIHDVRNEDQDNRVDFGNFISRQKTLHPSTVRSLYNTYTKYSKDPSHQDVSGPLRNLLSNPSTPSDVLDSHPIGVDSFRVAQHPNTSTETLGKLFKANRDGKIKRLSYLDTSAEDTDIELAKNSKSPREAHDYYLSQPDNNPDKTYSSVNRQNKENSAKSTPFSDHHDAIMASDDTSLHNKLGQNPNLSEKHFDTLIAPGHKYSETLKTNALKTTPHHNQISRVIKSELDTNGYSAFYRNGTNGILANPNLTHDHVNSILDHKNTDFGTKDTLISQLKNRDILNHVANHGDIKTSIMAKGRIQHLDKQQ